MFKWLIRRFQQEYSELISEKKGDDDWQVAINKGDKTVLMLNVDEILSMIGDIKEVSKKEADVDGSSGGNTDKKIRV